MAAGQALAFEGTDPPASVFLRKRPKGAPVYLFTAPGRSAFPGTTDGRIGQTRHEALAWMCGGTAAYRIARSVQRTPSLARS